MTHGDGEPGLANRCNSHFHRRVLEPLLPPPSAVTNRWYAPPYTVRPIFCHQLRMAFMAKLAVVVTNADTNPAFVPTQIVNAVGDRPAEKSSIERSLSRG